MTKYVSRAGEKIEYALKYFGLNPNGYVCADFGSNVGGFVDCLLQYGAKKVYAVETGYGVLDWKLRQDDRVVIMERTNAMHVKLPEKVDFISVDTSWTKLQNIIPNVLINLKDDGQIVALLKPHYEAEQKMIKKGKLQEEYIPEILKEVKENLQKYNLTIIGELESPILGEKGKNKEFLLYIKKDGLIL
jgi:23S rRNA (cytidine1920-2'-O)/16S rRNA (cytidine1409-2'-O)-methyltransferase